MDWKCWKSRIWEQYLSKTWNGFFGDMDRYLLTKTSNGFRIFGTLKRWNRETLKRRNQWTKKRVNQETKKQRREERQNEETKDPRNQETNKRNKTRNQENFETLKLWNIETFYFQWKDLEPSSKRSYESPRE